VKQALFAFAPQFICQNNSADDESNSYKEAEGINKPEKFPFYSKQVFKSIIQVGIHGFV
jgi:hypothetical protein